MNISRKILLMICTHKKILKMLIFADLEHEIMYFLVKYYNS